MSALVIRVENLSKRDRIGRGEPYCSLCHTPTRLLWKASTELLTGTSARKTGIRSALFFAGC